MNDPDGVALLLIFGLIGFVLLVAAACVERLLPPRHERHFDNLCRNSRGREAQARGGR